MFMVYTLIVFSVSFFFLPLTYSNTFTSNQYYQGIKKRVKRFRFPDFFREKGKQAEHPKWCITIIPKHMSPAFILISSPAPSAPSAPSFVLLSLPPNHRSKPFFWDAGLIKSIGGLHSIQRKKKPMPLAHLSLKERDEEGRTTYRDDAW